MCTHLHAQKAADDHEEEHEQGQVPGMEKGCNGRGSMEVKRFKSHAQVDVAAATVKTGHQLGLHALGAWPMPIALKAPVHTARCGCDTQAEGNGCT